VSVLIVTGGLVSPAETSALAAVRKSVLQWRASEAAWLDLKVKVVMAEPIAEAALERLLGGAPPEAAALMGGRDTLDLPELAEVALATALDKEGVPFDATTVTELFADPARRAALTARAKVVYLSTTLLRDLGELETVLALVSGRGLKVVAGGALASTLAQAPPRGVDVVAVGYGELLVPSLAAWARTGFGAPVPPEGGSLTRQGGVWVLRSGLPEGTSLDGLDTPDWAAAARRRGRAGWKVVQYESVRGCPYRCAFCNYPFLFDDTRFRYKSAARIADDWSRYAQDCGTEVVSCLDSLFTVPPKRLRELCSLLVQRGTPVRWLCYARADDLADEETAAAMKAAGCVQVQIGLESGDPAVLANMNKRVTPEANLAALENCRRLGMTTVTTLVVGFPGETEATLERTFAHLRQGRPDFHFLATFSTRAAGVPVLSPENRARFGLRAASNPRTTAPYWAHDTMSCSEAGVRARALNRRLALAETSLNAAVYYGGVLAYRPEMKPRLLAFQRRAAERGLLRRALFDPLNAFVDRRLAADVAAWLGTEPHPRPAAPEPVHA
jgi:radical SAM superfamily enzyme YgiQ (UPF0313 family)